MQRPAKTTVNSQGEEVEIYKLYSRIAAKYSLLGIDIIPSSTAHWKLIPTASKSKLILHYLFGILEICVCSFCLYRHFITAIRSHDKSNMAALQLTLSALTAGHLNGTACFISLMVLRNEFIKLWNQLFQLNLTGNYIYVIRI